MVFIQGGGWSSDSNGNFNGSLLVANSGMNMVVVTLNYRVGLLGSLASKEVVEAGSLNNGLKDGKLHFPGCCNYSQCISSHLRLTMGAG